MSYNALLYSQILQILKGNPNMTSFNQSVFPTPKYSVYLSYVCTSVVLSLDLVFLFSFDGQVVVVLELKWETGSVGLCFLSGFSPDLISDSQTLNPTVWCLCSLVPFLTNMSWVRWPAYVFSFHTVAVYLGGGREDWLHICSQNMSYYTIWRITNYCVIIFCDLEKLCKCIVLKKNT